MPGRCEFAIAQNCPRKGKPVARRGRKALGLDRSAGGTDKAARLPKGWTGPASTSGIRASLEARIFYALGGKRQCIRPAKLSRSYTKAASALWLARRASFEVARYRNHEE